MKTKTVRIATVLAALLVALAAALPQPDEQATILKTREAVWQAWFAGDTRTLQELVPADTIAISSGEAEWKGQSQILQSSAGFHADGGKLVRLEFPRTRIQRYGDVAMLYSRYVLETEENGKRSVSAGRVTEIFVKKDGKWTNPGWHTDTEK